ncbi:RES family NAD+ phosphorylase [Novosphingobium rosa]|uniref:RES family NAD+ phosphorylase n=1 Tax=Novosphingobium rosa TaxID=76978 RepID=UPI00082F3B89|nr:RES family NAD+ phosphorylase [Novosphingobium rosa]
MWTSTALASEHRSYQGTIWRLVEGQHRISTNRLARDGATQALLEELAEEVKPMVPEGARHLHFLLATPFRYGHKSASRFRRANERPGIFYAAEAETTAIAETAYWSLRFFSRSPGFSPPTTTVEYTSFHVRVATDRALDLTTEPFAEQEGNWMAPDDYTACQDLATQAREAQTALIRTLSVRAEKGQCNIVVLAPEAFEVAMPTIHRTWHFRHQGGRLSVLGAFPSEDRHEFSGAEFGL